MAARIGVVVLVVVAACLSISPAAAGGPPAGQGRHDPGYGPHWLLDTAEFPGVTCSYSNGILRRITARKPIMNAYDRTPKNDKQWVAWRADYQYADLPADNTSEPVWLTFRQSTPSHAIADEQSEAHFSNVTLEVPTNITDHPIVRVLYHLSWFYPGRGQSAGGALHWPSNYLIRDVRNSFAPYVALRYCSSSLN